MSRRATDLHLAALQGRHAGELLLMPCNCTADTHRWRIRPCPHCTDGYTTDGVLERCPHCWSACINQRIVAENGEEFRACPLCKPHSLGEHIMRSKRDQRPGPRAANTDPRVAGASTDAGEDNRKDREPPPDRTVNGDDEYAAAVDAFHDAARTLIDLTQTARPDRAPEHPTTSRDEWCRVHLKAIGACEPRARGDLCRWCNDFTIAYRVDPPEVILRARHEGQRVTQPMIVAALKATKTKSRKRKKAS